MSKYPPPTTAGINIIRPEQITELEKKLVEKENTIKLLTDKINKLEADVAKREDIIKNLTNQLENTNQELASIKASATGSNQRIRDIEHRLSQKELELTRLEGSVEDLSIAKKKIEDLQSENKKLGEEMRAFTKMTENEPRFIILKDLTQFGELRLNQIAMKAGVSPAQAKKWLEDLERSGLVEIHGEGRDSNPLISKKKK